MLRCHRTDRLITVSQPRYFPLDSRLVISQKLLPSNTNARTIVLLRLMKTNKMLECGSQARRGLHSAAIVDALAKISRLCSYQYIDIDG